ncbi:hypothetical protein EVG20_g1179 [Dentipellis fragilis]|uniref:Uncharacterized protein n=1 Tax=Dentipellis fragilis TaxID=205917 RepID=A0A4Y9ZBI4_9AGAM|nr:hypothetical protein EVG20_g1179 [Dentipellis fragilis]
MCTIPSARQPCAHGDSNAGVSTQTFRGGLAAAEARRRGREQRGAVSSGDGAEACAGGGCGKVSDTRLAGAVLAAARGSSRVLGRHPRQSGRGRIQCADVP